MRSHKIYLGLDPRKHQERREAGQRRKESKQPRAVRHITHVDEGSAIPLGSSGGHSGERPGKAPVKGREVLIRSSSVIGG